MSAYIPQLPHSPYSRSAFRVLGVTAEQSLEVLEARAREALAGVAHGQPRRPPDDLPWLPEVRQDDESLRQAWKALERVEDRIRQRLLWPHTRTAVDRQALEAARAGHFEQAAELWQQAWKDEPAARATAAHNLAILYHSRALAAPRGLAAATRDFEQARVWWRHVVEGGRLEALLLDGEGDHRLDAGLLEQVDKDVRRDLRDVLMPGRRAAGASGHLPLFGPGFIGQEDVGVESYEARRARMQVALEEAEEAARRGQREATETAIERARDLVVLPADARTVEEAWRGLAARLVLRGLEPVGRPPLVVSFSGLGTALFGMDRVDPATHSYEARLMFIVGHLPVLPLGRYRVRQRHDGTPEFLGRLPLDFGTLLHGLLVIGALMVCLWGVTHLTRMRGHQLDHLLRPGAPAASGPAAMTRQEAAELQRSHPARVARLEELDRLIKSLRAERDKLQHRRLPELEKKRDLEALHHSPGGERRLQDLDVEIDRCRTRLRQIPGEIQAVQEVRREIEALEHPWR